MFKILKKSRIKNGKRVESKYYYVRYKLEGMLSEKWTSLRVSDK